MKPASIDECIIHCEAGLIGRYQFPSDNGVKAYCMAERKAKCEYQERIKGEFLRYCDCYNTTPLTFEEWQKK